MKQFLLYFSFVISFSVFGQITITQNDFPAADDTAMISISDETNLDIITTGADAIWDFSDVHIMSQRIDTFYNLADASFGYQYVFNNIFEPDYLSDYYHNLIGFDLAGASEAGITIESPVGFVKITSSVVQNVGMGLVMDGYEIPMAADTIDTEFQLPMDYLDAWSSNSYMYVDLSIAFPAIFKRHQHRTSEVDGWGSITTRFGTFDVLRVKSNLTYEDSVYTDFGFGAAWYELPTPDQFEYTWWTNNMKVPVFRVTSQDVAGTETVTRVEFKDKERNLVGIETNENFEGTIYPNPATYFVNFTFDESVSQLIIYSITGELIYQSSVTDSYMNLDVTNWTKGVYLIKLVSDENVSSTKLVIE